MKTIEIIGGGTVSHIRNHLALTAPAYGNTARQLYRIADELTEFEDNFNINLHLTKMANQGKGNLETNEDISKLLDNLIDSPDTKIIFFNPALVDYDAAVTTSGPVGYEWSDNITTKSGKYEERLQTSKGEQSLLIWPAEKLVKKIRQNRKDIFLVAFKTTCGTSEDEQFLTGLNLLKSSSCNLVLSNDTKTRLNMIITPEQARYSVSSNRKEVLEELVKMALSRSAGSFTRSNVVSGDPIKWNSDVIPSSLREVVNYCINKGAYKPFNGSTVGHFAYKVSTNMFVTSKRKVNFNNLDNVGMVLCHSVGDNHVTAFGAKPSVGGQSQRIVFKDHPEMDCIIHFHCMPKDKSKLSIRSQKDFECGSHECGKNTSLGLTEVVSGIKCVYLDNHGPNIVFNKNINPQDVINFIDSYFDLSSSTDKVSRDKILVA